MVIIPKNPFFSVIIPTYNRASCIVRAVTSALVQSETDHEIIVIDDGSTDDTKMVLSRFGSAINYIYQENTGVSSARNTGINIARGQWIAFLDSDDSWIPEYLSTQKESIYREKRAVAHITNSVTIWEDGRVDNTFDNFRMSEIVETGKSALLERPLVFILKHQLCFLQSTVVNREKLLDSGLFNPVLSIAEDWDLIGRLALSGPFGVSNKILVQIRKDIDPDNTLTGKALKDKFTTYETFSKVWNNLKNDSRLDKQEQRDLNKSLSANRRALGNLYLMSGSRNQAIVSFSEALKLQVGIKSLVKYIMSMLPVVVSRFFIKAGNKH